MSKKEKLTAELLNLIKQQRARINPDILKNIALLIDKRIKGLEPYDKKTAAKAIKLFLEKHPNSAGFEKKLIEELKREENLP